MTMPRSRKSWTMPCWISPDAADGRRAGRETGIIIGGEQNDSLEAVVLGKERWNEVRRLLGDCQALGD